MTTHHRNTPEGTRDLLFEECAARRRVQDTLRGLFTNAGYDEVKTPTLEFYDVFSQGAGAFPQENMFKLTDGSGRLLVIRPDNTTPIARLAATRLKDARPPLRLFYDQEVFRPTRALSGKSLSMRQMGVELIGPSTYRADLQALMLAVKCLASQERPYRLEICHIGFFKAVMESLSAGEEEREMLRRLVEQKNFAAMSDALRSFPDTPAKQALQMLPELYGGEEAIARAEALLTTQSANAALRDLRRVYRDLAAMGLSDRIAIDLGVVHQADYYTGIVFCGYMEDVGEAVLLGGRYDGLLQAFGRPLCAVGFGVNIDLLAEQGLLRGARKGPAHALIHAREGCDAEAFAYMARCAGEGVACELSVFDTIEEALDYAKDAGIRELRIVGKAGDAEICRISEEAAGEGESV